MRIGSALALVAALAAGGCSGTRLYQPSRSVGLDLVDDREIDDDDVRRAFEARPQLEGPLRIAFYSLDDAHAEAIATMLSGLPGVADVYRLPSLLVTGRRRLDGGAPEGAPVTMSRLRLQAARAHCDLLVVFDHGYRIERRPNGFAALNVLLVPALVAPFVDAEVESYLDAVVVDTRNGYLYGNTASEESGRSRWLTVWSRADEELAEEQWATLLAGTADRLAVLLRGESLPAEPTAEPEARASADDGASAI